MKIFVWRGGHSAQLLELVRRVWTERDLLIVCPPLLKTFDFLKLLPEGEVIWAGEGPPPQGLPIERSENLWQGRSRPALGVFTSGTSSLQPKLVLYSRENLIASVDQIFGLFDLQRIDTVFCYPQPFHTFGLILGYVAAVVKQWKLVTGPGRYSSEFHKRWFNVESENLLTLGTPLHFLDLAEFLQSHPRKIRPTYSAIIGGAPVTRSLWLTLRDELKIEAPSIGYGCTEASPGLTHLRPGVEPSHDNEIGEMLPGVQMTLIPQIGLEFSGPNTCLSMIRGPEIEFPERILIHDHLRQAKNKQFTFVGRFDQMINRGGEKIALDSLQQKLKFDLGLETLCVKLADKRLGEDLGILVKTAAAEPAHTEKVINYLATEFGLKIAPSNVLGVGSFPMNPSLKFDRFQAAEWIAQYKRIPKDLTLPIPVQFLEPWTPHRASMIWIDAVSKLSATDGECTLQLSADKTYMTEGKTRLSAMIEWVAQSFSYVRAGQSLMGLCGPFTKPERAFLVGTRDAKFNVADGDASLEAGKFITVRVHDFHFYPPFIIFNGKVESAEGITLFSTQMKIFCQ